jgi:hypothetical protein
VLGLPLLLHVLLNVLQVYQQALELIQLVMQAVGLAMAHSYRLQLDAFQMKQQFKHNQDYLKFRN